MILPSGDTLTLSADNDALSLPPGATPLVIDRTQPAAGLTLTDYLQYCPSWARKGTSALRDAFLQTWAQMINELWVRYSAVLEAQATPRFAEGIWLDSLGQLLGKPRAPGEDDPTYRGRLLIAIDVVSPVAIKAAINTVFTTFYPNIAQNFIYNEPSIDLPFAGPASTSDPVDAFAHGSRQTIGSLSTWIFWSQPVAGISTSNQTVVDNATRRFFGTDPLTTKKYGAWAVPANNAQFWIVLQSALSDDSQVPYCHSLNDLTPAFQQYDFTYGIAGGSTTNQTVIAPASTGGPFITPVPCVALTPTSIVDQLYYEIERRRAAGVSWVFFQDLPTSQSF